MQAAIKKHCFLQRPWDRSSPPHVPAMLAVLCEVAQGMAYLHAHSIIHGDLNACVILPHPSPSTLEGMLLLPTHLGLCADQYAQDVRSAYRAICTPWLG